MTFTAASHPANCGGGVKYNYVTISVLHKPGYIYHIPYNNGAHHLLNIVTREEKVSFVSLHSPPWALYYVIGAL
jgi:hypothetical protein